ncbi:hypothetical protein FE257_008716 [Aspergillus nanangensis]|uniref:NB-ARC domain-containing protein n=1 Tax=Aspergillus nanangensis TaxID=2582783 RepID=A0AAD4CME8_ASPNN|nr:hypothetical protein FE257_008716 [Aspergillus nanangensis]
MSAESKVLVAPERPEEPGLDLIVVHGATTLGLPRLPDKWHLSFVKIVPANSSIISYDASLRVENNFSWKDIQAGTDGLLNSIWSKWAAGKTSESRAFVFIGIGLAGYIVKQTLYRFSQEHRYLNYLAATRGIIFLATPHFTASDTHSVTTLAGILRHKGYTSSKKLFTKYDLSSMVYSSWGFEELKLACPILSGYEQIPIKTRNKLTIGRSVAVQNHLRTFLEDTLSSLRKSQSPEDGAVLGAVLESTLSPGFGALGIVNTEVLAIPPLSLSRAPDSAPQPTSLPSTSHLHRSSSSFDSSSNNLSTPPVISNASSLSPRSAASDPSYILVPESNDYNVPDSVEYIQARSYSQPNSDYCGHETVIKQMEDTLLELSNIPNMASPNVFVLCGPAGLGKTQTALHFFHTYKSQFDIKIWVQANTKDSLFVAFREVSARLKFESKDEAQDAVLSRELVKGWLEEPFQNFKKGTGRLMKWLLVIDNADRPDDVLDFWPHSGQGSIILTSRDRQAMTQNYFGESGVELSVLEPEDAVSLLTGLLKRHHRPAESSDVLAKVAMTLEYWPLAIAQMAGIIGRQKLSLTKFLEVYKSDKDRYNYHLKKSGKLDGYTLTLAAAWALKDMSLGAARLLSVISLLAPASIPEEILTTKPEQAQLSGYPLDSANYCREIEKIESCSIITQLPGLTADDPMELSIHPLIQEVLRGQLMKNDDEIVSVFNATVRLLTTVWPFETLPFYGFHEFNRVKRWERCDKILPHATQLSWLYEEFSDNTRQKCITDDFLNILNEISWYLYQRSNYDASLEYIQMILQILDGLPGDHSQIEAGLYGTWSGIAVETNQAEVALEKRLENLAILEDIFDKTGDINSHITACYSEAGRAMIMNGMFTKAREFIDKSVSLRKQMPHFSRLQLYSPLYYTALIHLSEGKYEEAESGLLEALRDREVKYGKDDCESKRSGTLLFCLGNVLTKQGRHDEGFEYHQRALIQFRETGGEKDLDFANSCYKLASHYLWQNSLDLAKITVDKAIQILKYSTYCKGEYARALFLQSRIFQRGNEETSAQDSLQKSVVIRRQMVENDLRPGDELSESDFDDMVVIWRK